MENIQGILRLVYGRNREKNQFIAIYENELRKEKGPFPVLTEDEFQGFVDKFPQVMFPPAHMRSQVRAKFGGVAYWKRHTASRAEFELHPDMLNVTEPRSRVSRAEASAMFREKLLKRQRERQMVYQARQRQKQQQEEAKQKMMAQLDSFRLGYAMPGARLPQPGDTDVTSALAVIQRLTRMCSPFRGVRDHSNDWCLPWPPTDMLA